MAQKNLIGSVIFEVLIIETSKIVFTPVIFEDREDSIYFTWDIKEENGKLVGGKSQYISKKIIGKDPLAFSIVYAQYSIDHATSNRQKLFKILNYKII